MIIKRISSIAFAIAFLAAIVLFTGYGRKFISFNTAQTIFIVCGAIGIVLNLVNRQEGKHSPTYSILFWGASGILFIGFLFKIMHWPFATYIMIAGIILLGATFFIPSKRDNAPEKDNDLLDNFE